MHKCCLKHDNNLDLMRLDCLSLGAQVASPISISQQEQL
jgi:hypothetical protein